MERAIRLLLVVLLMLGLSSSAFAVVRYVTATGSGTYDGSSWQNASYSVQSMLYTMIGNNETGEIRVKGYADSTEYTDCGFGSIVCESGISIKGGYLGYDDEGVDLRNLNTYKTVLTCSTDTVIYAANCASDTVLDGLVIKGGVGRLINGFRYGGGIYCEGGPTISNCVITGNSAKFGAGICSVSGAVPQILNCTIENNTLTYEGSTTASEGAGILMYDAYVHNCTIRNNKFNPTCNGLGGGIRIGNYGWGSISSCRIESNGLPDSYTATNYPGGGIYDTSSGGAKTNNIITGNRALGSGGGVYSYNSTGTWAYNTFTNNSASGDGGGLWLFPGSYSPSSVYCNLFSGNSAANGGGLSIPCVQGTTTIANNTLVGNTGGGMHLPGHNIASYLPISNNIIASNTAYGIYVSGYRPYYSDHNCLYGNSTNYSGNQPAASSDIYLDPVLDSSCRLGVSSPCIDAGNDSAVQSTWRDINGEPRKVNIPNVGSTLVDIGADEYYPDYTTQPLVSRGLPTANLNQDAGTNRTNFRWAGASSTTGYGDSFALLAGPAWVVDKVVVWTVPDVPASLDYNLSDHYSNVTLYMSNALGVAPAAVKSATFTGTGTNSADVTVSRVFYGANTNYECADGTFNKIWKIEFGNLNRVVPANASVYFGVMGTPRVDRLWFNHASSGLDDGTMYEFSVGPPASWTSPQPPLGTIGWIGKSTDISVQVYAHPQ